MLVAWRRAEGLPVICVAARHAKAALEMAANMNGANDTDGLTQLAEVELLPLGLSQWLRQHAVSSANQTGDDPD